MQKHSKAGRSLSPELKAVIDPIYKRDPKRYANLVRFVWHQQSKGISDEAISNCVRLADQSGRLDLVQDWYPYLLTLMPKGSARACEEESTKYKREEKQFLDAILEHCRK